MTAITLPLSTTQPVTLGELADLFGLFPVVLVYCRRCALDGLYVPLENCRCPHCFEMHHDC